MKNAKDVLQSIKDKPGYTLMRGFARFRLARKLVETSRRLSQSRRLAAFLTDLEQRMGQSVFSEVNRVAFVDRLRKDGAAFGLCLPGSFVTSINNFALGSPCFADRLPDSGFNVDRRGAAESKIGKPILLAQYCNTASGCPAIRQLVEDPFLNWVAGRYLDALPVLVGVNLWWTFPVDALAEDRDRHAQLFHRDVDDFRFFKFFFYLSDVKPGDGGHVCVIGSHLRPPILRAGDRWNIRRYSDAEIEACYPKEDIVEITGPAGTGFAENTMCAHKGRTPTGLPRLMLQVQFALFDYEVMHDHRDAETLRCIA